jgi:probable rRNA maturation factor
MGVLIDNRQERRKLSLSTIRKKAQAVLNALDNPDAELSVVIVDDSEISELNQKYLNRSGATNVIAFPMREGEFTNISPQLLGDVLISIDAAQREGALSGISTDQRFDQLLIHGILHLLGYDHETNDDDARQMEEKSAELLELTECI